MNIENEVMEIEAPCPVEAIVVEIVDIETKPAIMKSTKAHELRLSANLKRIESAKKVYIYSYFFRISRVSVIYQIGTRETSIIC